MTDAEVGHETIWGRVLVVGFLLVVGCWFFVVGCWLLLVGCCVFKCLSVFVFVFS